MKLTEEIKKEIDEMSYYSMLYDWRFSSSSKEGILQNESGVYYLKIMLEKKETVDHIAISKEIGWDK